MMQQQKPHSLMSIPWGTTDVVSAICVVLVIWIGAMLSPISTEATPPLLFIMFIMGGALLGTAWWFGPGRKHQPLRLLGFRAPTNRGWILLPLIVLLASLLTTSLYFFAADSLGIDKLMPPPIAHMLRESGWPVPSFLLAVIWGPLAEETFFRGFLFPVLLTKFGVFGGVTITGALFALSHGTVSILLPVFVTGVLLTLLYLYTRSLWSCFAAHATQNAIAFLFGA